jgi:signal peptidase I
MTKHKNISIKNILKIVSVSLLIALVAIIIIGLSLGYKVFIVNGGSSEPMIKYRSIVIDKMLEPNEIRLGDILSYKSGNGVITHRLVMVEDGDDNVIAEFRQLPQGYAGEWEVGEEYIVDRSDLGTNIVEWYSGEEFTIESNFRTMAASYNLNPLESTSTLENVPYQNILGIVVFSIPYLGNVILFIQNNIILVVATIASLIILYNMILSEIEQNKKYKKIEEDKDDANDNK